jgi:uncharacterized protein
MASNREFQIFAKPVGAVCNLACLYCYYLGKESLTRRQEDSIAIDGDQSGELRSEFDGSSPFPGIDSECSVYGKVPPEKSSIIMSDSILESYIIQHVKASARSDVSFSWHGGEPLMAGIDFYRKVIDLQKKNIPPDKKIVNGLQTNGTLLNDEWCEFLSKEKFFVGVSIDGPEYYHDVYRKNLNGQPSFKKAMKGIELLKKYAVNFEILCVVHSGNAGNPLEVYRFLRGLGAGYMTFLPLVIKDPKSKDGIGKDSVPSEEFGNFMISVFDEWVASDIGKVKIQLFEEAARTAFDQDHTLCIFKKECGGVPVVEHNGNFYSCDHYAEPEYLVGNIMDTGLDELLDSEVQKNFGRLKLNTLPRYCINCEVREMCNGECPKNRLLKTPDGEEGLNYLCAGYKKFFNHAKPFIDAVATTWRNQNKVVKPNPPDSNMTSADISRNAPCPCGSGKKYKRCCL